MTPPIRRDELTRIAAGETVQWTRYVGDYPSTDGWTLKYYFRGASVFDVAGAPDPAGYLMTIAAADTANVTPGTYRWGAFVEKGAGAGLERRRVDEGVLQIEPNFATAAAGTMQTHAERMLAAIEARLEGRLQSGADMEQYGVAGRQVMKIPFEKLQAARVKYQFEVARQRNGGVLPPYEAVASPRRIPSGFGNASGV